MYERTHVRGASAPRAFLFACLAVVGAILLSVQLDLVTAAGRELTLALIGVGLLALGSTVYLLAPLVSRKEGARARAAYGTHRDILANVASAIAWGNLIFLPLLVLLMIGAGYVREAWQGDQTWQAALVGTLETARDNPSLLVFLSLVGLDIALILVVYLRTLHTGASTERELGLVGSHFLRNVALGIIGWFAIVTTVVAIGLTLARFGVEQTQVEQLALDQATPTVFLLLLGAGALLAPLAEEIFFRGYVFRSYLTTKGPVRAYVISALLFSILHLNPPAFLSLFAVGLILAFLYHRTGSLVAPIVAHGLNNAMALLLVYFVQQMQPVLGG